MLHGPSLPPRNGGAPSSIVLLLHGVGADGNDLIGLGPLLAERLPDTLFVAPDAPEPCDMAPFGRQWFSLQDRDPRRLFELASRSRPRLDELIDALLREHDLPDDKLALLGFSQGTMMSLVTALRRERPLAALVGFSGALLGAEDLQQAIRSRPPTLLVHGTDDPVVPVAALHHATRTLAALEVPVRWDERPALGHSIDPQGLEFALDFLSRAFGRSEDAA